MATPRNICNLSAYLPIGWQATEHLREPEAGRGFANPRSPCQLLAIVSGGSDYDGGAPMALDQGDSVRRGPKFRILRD